MNDVRYRLYKHKSLCNKWKVVRDDSTPPDCWKPIYNVVHPANGDKVRYTELK